VRGSRRHLPETGELRDIYLLSVVTAALIRGALLHALRPAAAHLTVKPESGWLIGQSFLCNTYNNIVVYLM
jgi:hypothetical protein